MINIPPWLVFLVAFWVVAFGVFRLSIAQSKRKKRDEDRPNFRRGGLYAQSVRRHIVFGVAYIVLGGVLVSMGLGVRLPIYGGCQGDTDEAPSRTIGGSIEVAPAE